MLNLIMISIAVVAMLLLFWVWVVKYGLLRGIVAALLRIGWLIPLFMALYPEVRYEAVPSTVIQQPINVFLDDSDSMQKTIDYGVKTRLQWSEELISNAQSHCQVLGCVVRVQKLSVYNKSLVDAGFTPLVQSIYPWIKELSGKPWILLSDGGDMQPQLKSPFTSDAQDSSLGLIVGFKPEKYENIWIKDDESKIVSFTEKPFKINITILREGNKLNSEMVQVLVNADNRTLAVTNASFAQGENEIDLEMVLPPLAKGKSLLTIKTIPTGSEKYGWDNIVHKNIDVMQNTIGILHLLGSPSWDGRFMRRYLKSEPKYDLISFFILRDPNDIQFTNERDLSLIPFPRDRLFGEELPNFKCIIIQDFSLAKFLLPAYQKNLVNYVKNGGSILFIGGKRALHEGDYLNADFASILPFDVESRTVSPQKSGFEMFEGEEKTDSLIPFHPLDSYKIQFALPSEQKRTLATVYDEWKKLSTALTNQESLNGFYDFSHVKFKENGSTPLLVARLADGQEQPLSVASYPGKGRALWIFSDSFYEMAINPSEYSSRTVYTQFMQSSIDWLIHREDERTVSMENFTISTNHVLDEANSWSFVLRGPASAYVKSGGIWQLSICGKKISTNEVIIENYGTERWVFRGFLPVDFASNLKCEAKIEAEHPAFGSIKASTATYIYPEFTDSNLSEAPGVLKNLSEKSGAKLIFHRGSSMDSEVGAWLRSVIIQDSTSGSLYYEKHKDYYWALKRWWFWIALCCIPLEVLVRRWRDIFAL